MRDRIIWVRNQKTRDSLIEILKTVPIDGTMEIEIRQYKPEHSDSQRRYAWVLLRQIAEYIPDKTTGKKHCAEYWHHVLKLHFGYIAETVPVKIGKEWVDAPQPKSLAKSASQIYRMNKEEVSDYITQLQQFMAERGVIADVA